MKKTILGGTSRQTSLGGGLLRLKEKISRVSRVVFFGSSFSTKSGKKLVAVFLVSLLLLSVQVGAVKGAAFNPATDCDTPNNPNFALACIEVKVFPNLLKSLVALSGVVAFLFLIKGGLGYVAAGGDAKALDTSRKTLTWAVIGLGFVIAAFFILQVINQAFIEGRCSAGAVCNILRFVIPTPSP